MFHVTKVISKNTVPTLTQVNVLLNTHKPTITSNTGCKHQQNIIKTNQKIAKLTLQNHQFYYNCHKSQ